MKTVLILGFLILSTIAYAQNSVFDETVVEKKNWEPAIPRPEQEKVADAKLKEFEQKHRKKPNILIFLVDDMGWGVPGSTEADQRSAPPPRTSTSWHTADCG